VEPSRLAAIPFFAALPEGELTAFAAFASETTAETGEQLTEEGEFGHCLYAIEAGTADVFVKGERIDTLGPGDVLGEVAVLSSGRRTATVVATAPMRLISFFKRDVWAVERKAPEAARRLRELIAENVSAI
jgi:CRP-like cAMP-binding protein